LLFSINNGYAKSPNPVRYAFIAYLVWHEDVSERSAEKNI